MKIILKWLVAALAILAAAYFIPGITVASFKIAAIAALVLGIINLTLRPILRLITLPLTLITVGLFSLVVNALCFWLVTFFVNGFVISGFVAAFLGSLLVSVVTTLAGIVLDKDDSN